MSSDVESDCSDEKKDYDPVFDTDSNIWRFWNKADMYSLCKDADVVQFSKARLIEWAGRIKQATSWIWDDKSRLTRMLWLQKMIWNYWK